MSPYSTSVAIIDDDEIFQMLVRKILEKKIAGGSILQFSDGFAALLYFKNNEKSIHLLPPVILLDLNMPGMDGWQFLKHLSKLQFSPSYTPSVFIISGTELFDIEKLRTHSFIKGYLVKPVAPAELLRIIHAETQGNQDGPE